MVLARMVILGTKAPMTVFVSSTTDLIQSNQIEQTHEVIHTFHVYLEDGDSECHRNVCPHAQWPAVRSHSRGSVGRMPWLLSRRDKSGKSRLSRNATRITMRPLVTRLCGKFKSTVHSEDTGLLACRFHLQEQSGHH
jgi:hypothetical protein